MLFKYSIVLVEGKSTDFLQHKQKKLHKNRLTVFMFVRSYPIHGFGEVGEVIVVSRILE